MNETGEDAGQVYETEDWFERWQNGVRCVKTVAKILNQEIREKKMDERTEQTSGTGEPTNDFGPSPNEYLGERLLDKIRNNPTAKIEVITLHHKFFMNKS